MNRRSSLVALILVGTLLSTAILAASPRHLMVGTWSLDVTKLTRSNPPKAVTIVLQEVGSDRFKMAVDIVAEDGAKAHGESTFKPDGTPYPASGSADVDIASMTMPSSRTLVMGAGIGGRPSNTRVFTISDDGKHMTETIIGHGANGTPNTQTNSWNRQ